ncbi:hypothetical protein ABFC53_17380 [Stenotrophomonas pavanii]|uniref:DUF4440 domain-containing protein n=1 Tax=Stenotrophomonas pavanii TaxID=487698 RepID=A0A246KWH6_9GAMM|nr:MULTISPECIES: hypothetical protein [Stenotrophomonas]MBN4943779.1 hypothetical protein [Stenotrophomonas maltophilia]TGR52263.1 hypothetical protein EN842_16225 [bacterium M00.F.Ca.ET.199.01.1.1]TGS97091.1 hypothetical protein EN820_40750 [bacterium M00.F.Ca.ET.177.01.1.1]TGT62941.1 hypothetical protein EN813_014915 [Mesorhizobium sp. M00.F.Ca.ET.170.01.1.1]TGU13955.1 hypothetical protein EN806_08185 [bacterium M00.F.Ca.ET.163.01.1.1]TGU95858.1 hypothetical protein EN794_016455 [Mesorhizob
MRRALFQIIPLLIAPWVLPGCSRPAAEVTGERAHASEDVAATAATDPALGPQAPALQASDIPLLAAVDDGAEPPSTMLNRYVAALLNRDRAASDAAWTIPPGDPRRADDAALRQLQDLRTLRLHSDPPIARDDRQPPQLLEVPVQVRAVTANGTFRFSGWYRVQPSSDGSAWQIHSAQLRPTLD